MTHPSRLNMNTGFSAVSHAFLGVAAVASAQAQEPGQLHQVRQQFCLEILTSSLELRSSFVSVHAAEALVTLGRQGTAFRAFLPQAESTEPKYRIGVWRVLARSAESELARRSYVDRIRKVVVDPMAEDRLHAIESLAKLHVVLTPAECEVAQTMAANKTVSGGPYALWCLANSGDAAAIPEIVSLLRSNFAVVQAQAAYVLWHLHEVKGAARQEISVQLSMTSLDDSYRNMLTAAVGGPVALEQARNSKIASARYLATMSLAETPELLNEDLLNSLLKDSDPDVRVAAAFAWCRKHSITP